MKVLTLLLFQSHPYTTQLLDQTIEYSAVKCRLRFSPQYYCYYLSYPSTSSLGVEYQVTGHKDKGKECSMCLDCICIIIIEATLPHLLILFIPIDHDW